MGKDMIDREEAERGGTGSKEGKGREKVREMMEGEGWKGM